MDLTQPIPVLDHGYLKFIEHYGSDERIVEAARMSTGKGFLGWEPGICPICNNHLVIQGEGPLAGLSVLRDQSTNLYYPCWGCEGKGKISGDKNLIRTLWIKKHATPFEMAGLIIEVQAPIFVFREWHRHRTQSYNEMSARYIPLPNLNYIPSVERLMMGVNPTTNKQSGTVKGAYQLIPVIAESYRLLLRDCYQQQEVLYQTALKDGVPKELARVHLPVGRYSRMRAAANLRNWLGFLVLRMDSAAQWEIRQYANMVGDIISQLFPRTWALFMEGRESGK